MSILLSHRQRTVVAHTLLACVLAAPCRGKEPAMTATLPRWPEKHPVIACSGVELARLRTAYRGTGPEHAPVAAVVKAAETALPQPLTFPPRGGQHNQWYQCDRCQIALKTVDATHHECPTCKHVYSGEPYDDVIFSRVHGENLQRLRNSAWAYALTEEPRFAASAKQILLGYAERYRQYPYHSAGRGQSQWDKVAGGRLFEQTLNESSCLATQIAPAYDLVHDAPGMTPQDHERIRNGLLLPMLESIDRNKAGKSNWQTWHNAGMLWGGAVLRDAAWITKALAEPDNGLARQMEISVTADGMWYENSWGYHFYTLSALVQIAEGARRLGLDLWPPPRFKAMFTLPVRYAMPDGSLPRFGDDVKTGLDAAQRYLEFAYHADADTTLLPYLAPQPTWDSVMLGRNTGGTATAPGLGSELFHGAGHAILRSSGEAGLAAALTFGPYGGFHGHFDKLSFVFFGHGTELGVDPGRAASQAYRLPIHTNWYKATLSHNTVLVDGRSQAGVAGELKLFTANGTHAAVVATCDTAYPGVRHQRLLLLTPHYLLVCDSLDADASHRFDWVYHSRGSSVTCPVADAAVSPGADTPPGFAYIQHARVGTTDTPVALQFKSQDVTTYVTVAAAPATGVMVGDGPGASVDDRVPLAMLRRQGRQARFVAVLEPVRGPALPTVTGLAFEERDGALLLRVQQGGATDSIERRDGRRLLVRRDATVLLDSEKLR